MKVRIGYGLGNLRPLDGERLGGLAEGMEQHGFDSLWLSERISGPAPDPVLGLTWAAARTKKIKLGTSVSVLPGRSPALVAKEWATLDVLSGGRALPAFGLGIANPIEQQAFGVARGDRAAIFDEALPLLRRLWTEDAVDHDGTWFRYTGMSVLPKPAHPLDVWLGGKAPSELRRVGRLGDGWLASFATPEQCAASRPVIEQAAASAGREIDPEHFGVMVFYTHEELPNQMMKLLATRNPDVDPNELVARGWPGVRKQCERFVEVGFSKLVLVPFTEPKDWDYELAAGAAGSAVTADVSAKELVTAFADRLERRDWPGLSELLAEDVVYEVPQTRERIRGRDRYVTFNAEYPGDWHIAPRVVLGDDHDGSLLFEWTLDDERSLAIAFFEVHAGRITKITDFWPEPYDPPPGREHLTERW